MFLYATRIHEIEIEIDYSIMDVEKNISKLIVKILINPVSSWNPEYRRSSNFM